MPSFILGFTIGAITVGIPFLYLHSRDTKRIKNLYGRLDQKIFATGGVIKDKEGNDIYRLPAGNISFHPNNNFAQGGIVNISKDCKVGDTIHIPLPIDSVKDNDLVDAIKSRDFFISKDNNKD